MSKYVIGIDYGSDSVRAVLIDAKNGNELASNVHLYRRWKNEEFCDSSINQFRQHPLDHIEGLENTVKNIIEKSDINPNDIKGICIDTTGSSPIPVDQSGTPLAFKEGFETNPNAMMVIWKDHTALKEANEINELAAGWGGEDYTKYEGGIYSSEWFWAKILHIIREDEAVKNAAHSWMEHCDLMTFLLVDHKDLNTFKRSRCAAGHKAMWHKDWDGLPSVDFLNRLDPYLGQLRSNLYNETYTSDISAGILNAEWADRLGLSTNTIVSVGTFDAHAGAVGGEIEPYFLSKIMGTSTCDILVAPHGEKEKLVKGICGQVDGSVIPGMLGLEAGQSAFGDIYAWCKRLLAWPIEEIISKSTLLDEETKLKLIEETLDAMIPELSKAAEQEEIGSSGELALDWMNGRRTPDANQHLKGVITGINLGSSAPKVFRALVESSCFGAKKIVDRFILEGIPIKGVIALGGVAKKSSFIMQVMADVLNMPIKVASSDQTCALGAGMLAATAAGIYSDVSEAIQNMGSGFDAIYEPNAGRAAVYEKVYEKYGELCITMESHIMKQV